MVACANLIYFKIFGFLIVMKFVKDWYQGSTKSSGASRCYRAEAPGSYWTLMMMNLAVAGGLLYVGFYINCSP